MMPSSEHQTHDVQVSAVQVIAQCWIAGVFALVVVVVVVVVVHVVVVVVVVFA